MGGSGTPEDYAAPVRSAVEGAQAPLQANAAADVAAAQNARTAALSGFPPGRQDISGGATGRATRPAPQRPL